jgi:hypothetical protein|tara:strand:- start:614 stop:910 length:297 start_codon:yes stop_codon:yes gene_type:complete
MLYLRSQSDQNAISTWNISIPQFSDQMVYRRRVTFRCGEETPESADSRNNEGKQSDASHRASEQDGPLNNFAHDVVLQRKTQRLFGFNLAYSCHFLLS